MSVSVRGKEGVGPQRNKCEQVSSDDHQMSLVGRGGYVQGVGGYPLSSDP